MPGRQHRLPDTHAAPLGANAGQRYRSGGRALQSVLARPEARAWVGTTGYASFTGRSRVQSPVGDDFRVSCRGRDGFDLLVEEWDLSPLSGVHQPRSDLGNRIRVDLITAGVVRYRVDGTVHEGRAGSAHVLSCAQPTAFQIPERTRVLRIVLAEHAVPAVARAASALRFGPAADSPLVQAAALLCDQILDGAGSRAVTPAHEALRAVTTGLVLDTLLPAPTSDLRGLMLAHIEQHLGDTDLTPTSIADAFGVSLRWAHQVFGAEGETLARTIRGKRVDRVASRLRLGDRSPLTVLAAQCGFSDAAQLTRTFKAVYGVTPSAFREGPPSGPDGGAASAHRS